MSNLYAAPRAETRTSTFEREHFDVWNEVPLVPQTTGMSCWAAAAAMLVGWRERVPVDPRAVATGAGRWAAYRDGLEPEDVPSLARAWGLQAEPATALTIPRVRELLEHNGPLWLGEASPGLHSLVVTGIYGDGTPDGTHVRINDPWPVDRGERYVLRFGELQRNFAAATLVVGDHVQLLHSGGRGRGARSFQRSFERRSSTITTTHDDEARPRSAIGYGRVDAGEHRYDTSTWSPDPLASHRHSGANLGLRWNNMDGPAELGGTPVRVDVVVHFHGDTRSEADEPLLTATLARSGLTGLRERVRPTLAIVPLGHLTDRHRDRPHEYAFPALLAHEGGGLEQLILASLAQWDTQLWLRSRTEPPIPLARLIFTASSRRGAETIERLLAHRGLQRVCNPEEIHLCGLPSTTTNLLAWTQARIGNDALLGSRDQMLDVGGALRILCCPDSDAADSTAQHLAQMIAAQPEPQRAWLREFYRIEHVELDSLLRDAAASLPGVRPSTGLSYGTPMGLFRRIASNLPHGDAAEALRRHTAFGSATRYSPPALTVWFQDAEQAKKFADPSYQPPAAQHDTFELERTTRETQIDAGMASSVSLPVGSKTYTIDLRYAHFTYGMDSTRLTDAAAKITRSVARILTEVHNRNGASPSKTDKQLLDVVDFAGAQLNVFLSDRLDMATTHPITAAVYVDAADVGDTSKLEPAIRLTHRFLLGGGGSTAPSNDELDAALLHELIHVRFIRKNAQAAAVWGSIAASLGVSGDAQAREKAEQLIYYLLLAQEEIAAYTLVDSFYAITHPAKPLYEAFVSFAKRCFSNRSATFKTDKRVVNKAKGLELSYTYATAFRVEDASSNDLDEALGLFPTLLLSGSP